MRRLGAILLAALLAVGGVLVFPAAAVGAAEDDGSDVSVTRFGGADRYETSLSVAEAVAADAGGSLSAVVLVSGRRWTDAVVAAPVAGALGAPVLMTPPDELRADALEFLQRVGVSSAVLVGPDASGGEHGPGRGVGAGVLEALGEAGITAERVAADDLYGTGISAARQVTPGTLGELGRTAVIASGEVFADALVAGPFAARGIHPVLLSPPDELHADVAGYLGEAGISHVVLMGGTAALSETVEHSVKDLGISVSRVAGGTRYDTAVKAAELVEGRYSDAAGKPCFDTATIGVARARVPFDSFSAAPLLSRLCAPLVLADPQQIPADTAAFLDAAREANDATGLQVFGGDAAVSQAAIDAYLTGEDPDTGEDDEAKDDEADGDEPSTAPGVLPAGTCGGAIDDEPVQLVPSTNAEDPAWSPDCSRLVYTQDGSLWTVNNDGTGARELVNHGGAYLHSAVWSPDGTRIAYGRGRHDENGLWSSHIWTVNVDGSHNNQRTEGDQIDRWPSWSPDGKWIAFERETGSGRDGDGNRLDTDRHIVVMTSYGNKPRALNAGGDWEHSPAWSPDGTRIAFQRLGALLISDVDGNKARPVHGGVFFSGGLSWSPDGTRMAFVRGDWDRTSVVIADIDDLDEEVVFDEGTLALAPRWSPDSQRIAFHTVDEERKHRSYVAGASGEPSSAARQCRPYGVRHTTAGFPLPDWAPSANGTVRVAVLFMDFPDSQAEHSTHEEADSSLASAEEYLEQSSYGKLDIEFVPHHTWLRAEQPRTHYLEPEGSGRVDLDRPAGEHAVALADAEFDFADIDAVMTVFPRTHFRAGVAGGFVTADGADMPQSRINSAPRDELRALVEADDWGFTAAHELAHNLGLLDMYPFDGSVHELPETPSAQEWIPVDFGLMHLEAYFLADASLMLRRVTRTYPDGARSWRGVRELRPREMLAWSRWQLGWLGERQATCVTGAEATVTLSPIAQPGGGIAMAAMPVNGHEVIVIESRRKLGYDRGPQFTWPRGGTGRRPALIEEGVLVYSVDTLVRSGALPVKIAGDSGNGQVADFPVLRPGESVSVLGYTITVTADDGDTHTVSITREL